MHFLLSGNKTLMKNVLAVSSLENVILSQTKICVWNGITSQEKQAQTQVNIHKTWRPMAPISYVDVKGAVLI